jgi:hypothetical protein
MFASCCPLIVQLALLAAPTKVHFAATGNDRAAALRHARPREPRSRQEESVPHQPGFLITFTP